MRKGKVELEFNKSSHYYFPLKHKYVFTFFDRVIFRQEI